MAPATWSGRSALMAARKRAPGDVLSDDDNALMSQPRVVESIPLLAAGKCYALRVVQYTFNKSTPCNVSTNTRTGQAAINVILSRAHRKPFNLESTIMLLSKSTLALLAALLIVAPLLVRADDKPADKDRLSGILVPGEDWQVIVDNLGFADGSSADADGNLYFSDLKSKPPVVIKVGPDGKQTKIAEAAMSGTKIAPDAR